MTLKSRLSRLPAWAYGLGLLAIGFVLGVTGMTFPEEGDTVGRVVVGGLLAVVVLGGSILYWRRLDEAAREAHKFAWYWGGSAGLGVALVVMVTLLGSGGPSLRTGWGGGTDPADFVVLGMIGTMTAQIAGYLAAWVGWWVARR